MENFILTILIIAGIIFIVYLWTNRNTNEQITTDATSKKEALKMLIPLKIQAYERLVLFLERSKPTSLVTRLLPEASSPKELKILLLNTINQELEHNYSQQIYVSESLWQQILFAKEKLQQLINKAAREQKEPTVQSLAEQILLAYANGEDFMGQTLFLLRNEAKMLQL